MMLDRLNIDLKDAMKSKDKVRLDTLRLMKTALMNEKIKLMVTELTEEQEISVIAKEVKQRKDSIEEFEKAGRIDLSQKEKAQLEILQTYLPKPLSENEINDIIESACNSCQATSMKDMGKVMNIITPQVKGRADMGKVSQLVKKYLNKLK